MNSTIKLGYVDFTRMKENRDPDLFINGDVGHELKDGGTIGSRG